MSRRREDGETKEALHQIVNEMYKKLEKGETPTMTLPVRTKLNIDFDKNSWLYGGRKTRNCKKAPNRKG